MTNPLACIAADSSRHGAASQPGGLTLTNASPWATVIAAIVAVIALGLASYSIWSSSRALIRERRLTFELASLGQNRPKRAPLPATLETHASSNRSQARHSLRNDVTHSTRTMDGKVRGRGTVRGTGHRIIPARRVPSVPLSVLSVQLAHAAKEWATHNVPSTDPPKPVGKLLVS